MSQHRFGTKAIFGAVALAALASQTLKLLLKPDFFLNLLMLYFSTIAIVLGPCLVANMVGRKAARISAALIAILWMLLLFWSTKLNEKMLTFIGSHIFVTITTYLFVHHWIRVDSLDDQVTEPNLSLDNLLQLKRARMEDEK